MQDLECHEKKVEFLSSEMDLNYICLKFTLDRKSILRFDK